MNWKPNNVTREAIGDFLENMVSVLPVVMGIDEVIAGCKVISLDPYGVGVGTYPRYIQVALRDRYYQDIMYRGGLSGLAVNDYVTVVHMRDGNRYELMTAGGSTGVVVNPAPAEAHYVTTQADATLTNEYVAQAGQWTAVTVAAGTFQTDFHPDNPVVVTAAGVVTEYATIQDAIDAAASCDTVLVPPGTYSEAITLSYGVAVKGFGHRAKIIISSATDTVTTAQYGWLENVTIVANNPNAGAFAGVKVSHNGPCWLRDITIEVDQGGANVARGIGTFGANSGTLTADRIDISVVSSAAGAGAAYGVDFTLGSYELELKNFKIVVAHTGAAAGDDAYGIVQAGSTVVKATEGWLDITAAAVGAATDLTGTITYSEIVDTADNTRFGQNVGIGLAPGTAYHLVVQDSTLNTAAAFRGIYASHTKTAGGASGADYYGIQVFGTVNEAAGGVRDLIGMRADALLTDGTVSRSMYGGYLQAEMNAGAVTTDVFGMYFVADLNDGDVGNNVLGLEVRVDIEPFTGAGAIGGNVYGQRIWIDVDEDPVGSAYALYIDARTNVDYGIYATGGDKNYFSSFTGFGTVAPGARVEVNGDASDDPLTILDALDDADSAFIDFKGATAANCTASISTLGIFAFAVEDHIKIKVNGIVRYLRTYLCDAG